MGLNYNPTIVPDGLVMYFDPANSRSSIGSGNTINDLTGNSNTCTFSATPTYDVASKGNLLLAGYGTVPHTSTLWGSNQFTLSLWAKKTSGSRGIMISKDTNYIDHAYNGKTLASFYATASYSPRQYLLYGNTPANFNEWRYYTSTYDGTVGSLYENGALIGTTNMSVEIEKTADPFNIGRWNGGSIDFSGKFGTIMTYNRALSAQEVKQNYDATKGRYITPANIVTSGLVLNYDMSDYRSAPFSGTSIYDLSGSGNTGTLTNGPTYSSLNDGCIVFDGSNDFITVPSVTSISGDLSVLIWFRTSGSNVSAARLIEFDYINGFWLGQAATGTPSSNWGGGIKEANGPYGIFLQFSDNEWNLISSVRSSTTHFLYKNNLVSSTSNTVSGTVLSSTAGMYIGAADNVGSVPFNGRIGQILIYNRALTQQEVLQNYNATKSRFGL
jgi:hypothetical protein